MTANQIRHRPPSTCYMRGTQAPPHLLDVGAIVQTARGTIGIVQYYEYYSEIQVTFPVSFRGQVSTMSAAEVTEVVNGQYREPVSTGAVVRNMAEARHRNRQRAGKRGQQARESAKVECDAAGGESVTAAQA